MRQKACVQIVLSRIVGEAFVNHAALAQKLSSATHPKHEADALAEFMPYRAPVGRGEQAKPLLQRLMSRVAFAMSDCWHWRGQRNRFGYGRMTYLGREQMAHRLFYETFVGPIPSEMFVLHHCDNPSCVNPEHLWLGTYSDNRRDCQSKGRWQMKKIRRGFTHQSNVVTPSLLETFKRLRVSGVSYARIAAETGVSTMTVWHAVNRRFK